MTSFFLFSLSFTSDLWNPFYVPCSKGTRREKQTWSLPSEPHSLVGSKAVKNHYKHDNYHQMGGQRPIGCEAYLGIKQDIQAKVTFEIKSEDWLRVGQTRNQREATAWNLGPLVIKKQNRMYCSNTGNKAGEGSSIGVGWEGMQEPCNTCQVVWTWSWGSLKLEFIGPHTSYFMSCGFPICPLTGWLCSWGVSRDRGQQSCEWWDKLRLVQSCRKDREWPG